MYMKYFYNIFIAIDYPVTTSADSEKAAEKGKFEQLPVTKTKDVPRI